MKTVLSTVNTIQNLTKDKDIASQMAGEYKSRTARKELFNAYLSGVMKEAKPGSIPWMERFLPGVQSPLEAVGAFEKGKYMNPKGNVDANRLLKDLGKSPQDFKQWAMEKYPDLADVAFPAARFIE
jgi:hypothetical protein